MGNTERVPLNVGMDAARRIIWRLGWNPTPTYYLFIGTAISGWLLLQHPIGLVFGLLGLVPRWKAISLINKSWQEHLDKAESLIKEQGATRLGVNLNDAQVTVLRMGRGKAPFGATPNPEYSITVVYICEAFFAVYQEAILSLSECDLQLPTQGEEVYFRHVSVVNYNPPNIEVTLANGKTMRQFAVSSEGAGAVLGALRAKLRGANHTSVSKAERNLPKPENNDQRSEQQSGLEVDADEPSGPSAGSKEERYCYLRLSKLRRLLSDASVLDVLVEQLEVPGAPKNLKRLTLQEKMECVETQIDHFRRTPTSVWHGVPTLEVLAASLWRAGDDPFYREKGLLTKKLVRRGWFSGVSEEADLQIPVARWLRSLSYEPYMEIPLGMARVDVLGHAKGGLSGSGRLLAVELKNDYEQFKRAINQMGTFAEYTDLVYMACTPDFAAEYLNHNEQSTGHWDREALERKLTAGGFGLLIIEREQVFEVVKPVERTPSSANSSKVVGALSVAKIVEC
jgi:hypothetical protein